MKHKGIDYKTSAVQYYLNNNESMDKVCKIFNCKKTTLKDINLYIFFYLFLYICCDYNKYISCKLIVIFIGYFVPF